MVGRFNLKRISLDKPMTAEEIQRYLFQLVEEIEYALSAIDGENNRIKQSEGVEK